MAPSNNFCMNDGLCSLVSAASMIEPPPLEGVDITNSSNEAIPPPIRNEEQLYHMMPEDRQEILVPRPPPQSLSRSSSDRSLRSSVQDED
mmetsp:Transcript_35358/g.60055  ORF Transcript_35358/g.60055 Transcript_35358/m.60055 type:complete len:90 (-) Transcript_35358:92-361(-)